MAAPAAPALESITDIESLVIGIVVSAPPKKKLLLEKGAYELADPTSPDMLAWADPRAGSKNAELQDLAVPGFARVGTVGDGNCMLHSFLYALSPTYRAHNRAARAAIADQFRNVLIARRADLEMVADMLYYKVGGAAAAEEWFETLEGKREELNIEMGALIAHLYNVNFLAIQIRDDMSLKPVCMTLIGHNPGLPTVLVNYIGGGVNVGNTGFMSGGHYEAILKPVLADTPAPELASKRRTTHKRTAAAAAAGAAAGAGAGARAAAPTISLDEVRTHYLFSEAELAPILALFATGCSAMLRRSSNSGSGRKNGSGNGSGKARAGAGSA
jgi:hypothetical protein